MPTTIERTWSQLTEDVSLSTDRVHTIRVLLPCFELVLYFGESLKVPEDARLVLTSNGYKKTLIFNECQQKTGIFSFCFSCIRPGKSYSLTLETDDEKKQTLFSNENLDRFIVDIGIMEPCLIPVDIHRMFPEQDEIEEDFNVNELGPMMTEETAPELLEPYPSVFDGGVA